MDEICDWDAILFPNSILDFEDSHYKKVHTKLTEKECFWSTNHNSALSWLKLARVKTSIHCAYSFLRNVPSRTLSLATSLVDISLPAKSRDVDRFWSLFSRSRLNIAATFESLFFTVKTSKLRAWSSFRKPQRVIRGTYFDQLISANQLQSKVAKSLRLENQWSCNDLR